MIKINVTQKDINSGVVDSGKKCPIARALKRKGFEQVFVDTKTCLADGMEYGLPIEARNFIGQFDYGRPVKPFSFILGAGEVNEYREH